jgi:hypothetical protein
MPAVTLANRALVEVGGPDAEDFLQALITTDIAAITAGEAWPGALLTPQGKLLFEFLVARTGDGFALETAADQSDGLVRRLMLYRLRAKVTLAKADGDSVDVSWGMAPHDGANKDMRFAKAGVDLYRSVGTSGGNAGNGAYLALRAENGISGGGEDGATDAFPHDLLMDLNGGVSFKKGCYIGQEVVSRMQHRGTARRRLVTVASQSLLPPAGTVIVSAGREIGTILSSAGNRGTAIVRIDKAGAALTQGEEIAAAEVPLTMTLPSWSGLAFPKEAEVDGP